MKVEVRAIDCGRRSERKRRGMSRRHAVYTLSSQCPFLKVGREVTRKIYED